MWELAVWIVYLWVWVIALSLGLALVGGVIYVIASLIYGAAVIVGLTATAPITGGTALYRWAKRLKNEPEYRRVTAQRWRIGLIWTVGYLVLVMLAVASKRVLPAKTSEALWSFVLLFGVVLSFTLGFRFAKGTRGERLLRGYLAFLLFLILGTFLLVLFDWIGLFAL